MGKIKGWNKINETVWSSRYKSKIVEISKNNDSRTFPYSVKVFFGNTISRNFNADSFFEAKQIALNYMRRHPNG